MEDKRHLLPRKQHDNGKSPVLIRDASSKRLCVPLSCSFSGEDRCFLSSKYQPTTSNGASFVPVTSLDDAWCPKSLHEKLTHCMKSPAWNLQFCAPKRGRCSRQISRCSAWCVCVHRGDANNRKALTFHLRFKMEPENDGCQVRNFFQGGIFRFLNMLYKLWDFSPNLRPQIDTQMIWGITWFVYQVEIVEPVGVVNYIQWRWSFSNLTSWLGTLSGGLFPTSITLECYSKNKSLFRFFPREIRDSSYLTGNLHWQEFQRKDGFRGPQKQS